MEPPSRILRRTAPMLAITGLFSVFIHGSQAAVAADFTVSGQSTVTNGGNVLNGNDSLTVTGAGSIATTATDAVFATGGGNTITNSGTLSTTGASDDGIDVISNNIINNIGSILTAAANAFGIFGADNNTITISGRISTTGTNSDAVNVADNNTITNTGTVSTTGRNADALNIDDDNKVTNSGTISTTGRNADGIDGDDRNTIVNSGTITTTGQLAFGIIVDDNNSVTNSGTITVSGEDAEGISVDDDNTVVNSGKITTSGDNSEGIKGDNKNVIINSGSIESTGDGGEAIDVDDDNTVTNSGTIKTAGIGTEGIQGEDRNKVTNSGSISTTGENSEAIDVGDSNSVVNTGSLSTTGMSASAIRAVDGNSITSSGTVATSGAASHAIEVADRNTVSNSGDLKTSGTNANGIKAGDTNTITNSGRVISQQSKAFALGTNNTLNLNAPSFIAGEIDLGTNTTLNITTGPPHSVLWTFTGTMAGGKPNVSGDLPFFYNAATKQFATYDPTGLAGSVDNLAGMSGILSNLLGQRLLNELPGNTVADPATAANAYVSTTRTQAANRFNNALNEASSTYQPQATGAAWISAMGAQSSYSGNASTNGNAYSQNFSGFAAGYDWSPIDSARLGITAGYMNSTMNIGGRVAGTVDKENSGYFAGIYGSKSFDRVFVNAAITLGSSSISNRRFVNDNLATNGVAFLNGNASSFWISPEVAAGINVDIGGGWIATPLARLRYASQWIDGYSETGGSAGATFGALKVAVGEASAEFAISRSSQQGRARLHFGVLHRASLGDRSASVSLVGQSATLALTNTDRTELYFGGSTIIHFTEVFDVELGGQYQFSNSSSSLSGNVKLIARF